MYRNDFDELRRLVEGGVDINSVDGDGLSLLMNAILVETPSETAVRLLVDAGADVNFEDSGQGWTALHFAARDQNAGIVKLLLEAGARTDSQDMYGNTPLWRAVMNNNPNLEIVNDLLKFHSDPYCKNLSGVSPIDIAENTQDQATLCVLSKQGQDN